MRQPDNVRAFKNELRNYTYYLRRVISIDNSIEYLYDRLGGVRGIDPSKEPLHSPPDKDLEYKLRDDISNLERKKSRYESKIKDIDETLIRIEEPIRTAIKCVYIEGNKVVKISDMMYLSPTGLVKRMNKAIKKALD